MQSEIACLQNKQQRLERIRYLFYLFSFNIDTLKFAYFQKKKNEIHDSMFHMLCIYNYILN